MSERPIKGDFQSTCAKDAEIFPVRQEKIFPISNFFNPEHNPLAMNEIQKKIQQRLTELDITPNFASSKAGLDNSYVRNFLSRENPSMRLVTAQRLATALETSPEWLMSDGEPLENIGGGLSHQPMRIDPEMLKKAWFSAKRFMSSTDIDFQDELDEYKIICHFYEQDYRDKNNLPPLKSSDEKDN